MVQGSVAGGGASDAESFVRTPLGAVQGTTLDRARIFRGIPYAEDPARWQRAERLQKFSTDVLDAKSQPPACPQLLNCRNASHCPAMSESCLMLNIVTPRRTSELKPVLVFIHGGAFMEGFAAQYDGTSLVNRSDLVFVAIQYRLGTLGFLHLDTPTAQVSAGGLGMYDQQMALQWISQHISFFGGDPSRVTIAGESAGGMSVAIHLATPGSSQLFQQAIMESGPIGVPLQSEQQASSTGSAQFLRRLGCGCSNASLTLECLLAKSVDEIMEAQQATQDDILDWLSDISGLIQPWAPTIGDSASSFLKDQPLSLWQQQQVPPSIPLLMGTVENEGVMFAHIALPKNKLESDVAYPAVLKLLYGDTLGEEVLHAYPIPHNQSAQQSRDFPPAMSAAAKAITNGMFKCPLRNASVSISNPVFLYNFKVADPNCLNLTCHADELQFLYMANGPSHLNVSNATYEQELLLSVAMQNSWGAFVQTGNPNTGLSQQWPAFTHNQTVHEFALPNSTSVAYLFDGCEVWDKSTYF